MVRSYSHSWCQNFLIRHWIARFGIPNDIISDRGAQFTSCLWTELVRSLGVTMHQTTAYHPQANGMIERLHRQLKNSLKARTDDQYLMDHLPMVLLRIRTARREDPYCLPAELVYGPSLRIPGEFVEPTTSVMYNLLQHFFEVFKHRWTMLYHHQSNTIPLYQHTCLILSLQQDMYMFELMDIVHHSNDHTPDLFELSLPQTNTLH